MIFSYDLHIHSALSPCAEEEMTPNNILNMAAVRGIDMIAVTDHNSTANLKAFSKCAEDKPVIFIPGIEVESAEEVHIICLFPDTETACRFGEVVRKNLPDIRNDAELFGYQYIMDENDDITGHEEQMLLFASSMTLEEVFSLADRYGGAAYFAHADRNTYSVYSALGTLPEDVDAGVIELSDSEAGRAFAIGRKELEGRQLLYCSDAHRLADMSICDNYIDLPVKSERPDAADVVKWIRNRIYSGKEQGR